MLVLAHDSYRSTIQVMHTAVIFFIILYLIFLCYRILQLLQNIGRIHQFITELLHKRGGTILFREPWFTNREMLITCDPANVRYILTKNFHNFPKGPHFRKIFDILGEGIFNAESESWENQRKTAKSLISHTSFQDFVATTSFNKVETGLIPILELVSELGTEIDLQELFKRLAFDCSCILVLGHDPVSLCNELPNLPHEKAFADAEEAIFYRHMLPEILWKLQKWLHIGTEEKLSRAKEILGNFMSYCMWHKQQNYGNMDFDILASYMRLVSEKGDRASNMIPEEVLKDIMFNLVGAGKDTISATLSWFFWLIATNPHKQEEIRQEILTNNFQFGNIEEIKKLIYLHAALCESLRLFPPVALQHKAPLEHDVLPSGHKIKPNTKMVLSFYSMARMETIWGEDCLEFKPGRWISGSGNIKTESSYKFTAFNSGPRSCLGKEMSFIQMKIFAAAIISRFKIQVVEGHSVLPSNSIVLHMKYGLKVKVSGYEDV